MNADARNRLRDDFAAEAARRGVRLPPEAREKVEALREAAGRRLAEMEIAQDDSFLFDVTKEMARRLEEKPAPVLKPPWAASRPTWEQVQRQAEDAVERRYAAEREEVVDAFERDAAGVVAEAVKDRFNRDAAAMETPQAEPQERGSDHGSRDVGHERER